ncbi:MAG: tetratricopeptide repeat protein, partial [Polyangiaceae bacterium]|nr:tetratricopeptide repeat protein [Polyangiaceae bacterium]
MITVRELEARDRLDEAAELAAKLGDHRDSARLWEQACQFDRAALAALAAGDAARALDLAIRSGQPELEARASAELAKTPREAGLSAARLGDQGRHASAARLWLALGDLAAAAAAFERVGAWLDAARAHRAAGEPRRAARALEQAVDTADGSFEAHVLLGELYVEHARHDAAVRVLQKVPAQAPERARALAPLVRALAALGLGEGVRALEPELAALRVEAAPVPPAAPAEPLPDAVLFGRYRVVAEVARTPTARVVRAVDQIGGREVAVKLFSAASLRDSGRDALARFEREAVALGKLRHPAIVPLHAYFPDGPAVVLEWMAGGSLADLLEAGTISPARAAEIACAVLGALSEAHRRGI